MALYDTVVTRKDVLLQYNTIQYKYALKVNSLSAATARQISTITHEWLSFMRTIWVTVQINQLGMYPTT